MHSKKILAFPQSAAERLILELRRKKALKRSRRKNPARLFVVRP